MSLRRDPLFALRDIAESAEAIADYTAGVDEEALLAELDSAPPPPSADREEK